MELIAPDLCYAKSVACGVSFGSIRYIVTYITGILRD